MVGHLCQYLDWHINVYNIYIFFNKKETEETEGIGALLGIAIVLAICGLLSISDFRTPIVKATVNEEVTWQEINNKYELAEQEDQIYIFKVKNTTIEEW